MSEQSTQELIIPSTPDQIQIVEERAGALAKIMGFNEDARDAIAIAITEMVANAIFHGNKADPNKSVFISFTISKKAMTITIRDEGRGFNPQNLADPLAPENLLKDSGRGIFIVRTLMDDIQFRFTPTGTEVILYKEKRKKGRTQ